MARVAAVAADHPDAAVVPARRHLVTASPMANVPPPPTLPGVTAVYSGKVRDLYEYPDGTLLFVASDRMSAYDWVLPTTIPDKGRILTAMTLWWFEQLQDLVPNHLVSVEVPDAVAGRAMVTQRLDMFPVECVARGYLTGSGSPTTTRPGRCAASRCRPVWSTHRGCLSPFSPRRPRPTSVSTTRTSTSRPWSRLWAADDAEALRALTLQIYARAEEIARSRGIIVADTKFEFGRAIRQDWARSCSPTRCSPPTRRVSGQQMSGNRADAQPSFDKQYVRDWLTSPASGWDRHSGEAPPPLPDDVVAQTRAKYVEAYERLTGQKFD